MSRRLARETVIQALYECEFHPENEVGVIKERGKKLTDDDQAFYSNLSHGVLEKRLELDQAIQKYLKKGWSIDRLSTVDRMILRLGAYELLHHSEVPNAVVLNEAVELAKAFSGEEAARFINGVLGSMVQDLKEEKSFSSQA